MKLTLKSLSLLALASTALAELPFFEGLTPTLDARLRTESRNQQGLDPSLSTTIRVRPGLQTSEWYGFSAFAETEHTYAIVDDFKSSPPGATTPNRDNNTVIADPETNEINQAYLQFKSNGLTLRGGRQRINLDGQNFIGGVAWRQNEQTYEGVTAVYAQDSYKLTLGYINQVFRIFGSQVPGPLESLEGGDGGYIANLSYTGDGFKAVAYSYLLDFDQGAFANSNTYGGYVDVNVGEGKLNAEFAFQTEGSNSASEYNDYYAHVGYSQTVAGIVGSIGAYHFGQDFRAPLSTAHKFHGFADQFLLNQIGLNPNWNGLTDFYISGVKKGLPGGLKAVGALHYFMDEDMSETYGWEADAVLVKKLSKSTTALLKAAYIFADNDSQFFPDDIAQVTLDFNYKF